MKGLLKKIEDNWRYIVAPRKLLLTWGEGDLWLRYFVSKRRLLICNLLLPTETVRRVRHDGYEWAYLFRKEVDQLVVSSYMRGRTKIVNGAKTYFIEVVRYIGTGEFKHVIELGSHGRARRAYETVRSNLAEYIQSMSVQTQNEGVA